MRRRKPTFRQTYLTALFVSAVLLVAVGVGSLWTRVGWDGLISDGHWARFRTQGGNVEFAYARSATLTRPTYAVTLLRGRLGVLSFGTGSQRSWRWAAVTTPLWVIVALLLVHPAVAFVLGPVRRRYRYQRNQCIRCGYDLKGNVSGRCPECGDASEDGERLGRPGAYTNTG
jgi:hypothetical protein